MRETKRRLEAFSFFDHTGISRHLEDMARKGWMIEKLDNFGWIYRRIEPKEIHFFVSYFPKASEFDPEPTEEQKRFHDFCEHAGWKLACTSAQIQIFYNEQGNPIPIETEPELEVEAIHASAKKSFLPSYFILMFVALLQGAMFVSSLLGDPISLLASPSNLVTGFSFLLLFLLCSVEIICYFAWKSKAKKAAEHGEFSEVFSTSKFQKVVLIAVGIALFYWIFNSFVYGDNLYRWICILACIYMPLLIFLVNATKNFLKKKKASRGVNRTLTIMASFIGAYALMGVVTFIVLKGIAGGMFAEADEETYEHHGATFVIHQDELPLTVEDLLDVEYKGYIKERRGNESFLLGQLTMSQHPRFDAEDYRNLPCLDYTMVIVKLPMLYDLCKERLIYEQETLYPINKNEYRAEDAVPWGANEAYRLYDTVYGVENSYLLCCDDILVEIHFSWEPTEEQKAIVGEKLIHHKLEAAVEEK